MTAVLYSKFPQIPDLESYDVLMDQMHRDFASFTKYGPILKEIERETTVWEAKKKDLENRQFTPDSLQILYQQGLKQYDLFDSTREKVKVLFKSFKEKQEICFPKGNCPLLDETSLMVLKRLNIDLRLVQTAYDQLLTANFQPISEEFLKMKKGYETMEMQLSKLEKILETAAIFSKPGRTVRFIAPSYLQMDLEATRKNRPDDKKESS